MRGSNLARLARNEWAQEAASRGSLVYDAAGVLMLLAYTIAAFAIPLRREEYSSPDLLASVAERFPHCGELTLVRIVVADRVFPALLAIVAAVWPGLLATTSLSQEKDKRTLECLLLLPASDAEILAAKVLSAAAPAILVSWLIHGCTTLAAARFMSVELAGYLLNPRLLIVSFLSVPALSLLSSLGGVVVSATVADSKTALALAFIPGSLGLAGFVLLDLSSITFSSGFVLLVTFLIASADVIMCGFTVAVFSRERLLLRLK